jgi:hypothetical protein
MADDSTRTPRVRDDLILPPGASAEDERLRRLVAATSRWCSRVHLPAVLPPGRSAVPDDQAGRTVSGAALSLAVAVRCGALDPSIDPSRATGEGVRAVAAVVAGHRAVGGTAWGRTWQSPLTSGQVALAGWLLDPALPDAVRAGLHAVVRDEADLLCGTPLRWLRAVDGTLITPGDTGAEEESWRARGLSAARALLPADASEPRWLRWQVLRSVAAYARPFDTGRADLLHRSPFCAWLAGSNLEEDGTLQNHGYSPQPNYMRPVHHLVSVAVQRLAGQPVSPSALSNLELLYEALRRHYTGDGGLHYPGGTDVGARTALLYANDALHRAVGLGGAEALRWEQRHGDVVEGQVAPDGSVVQPGLSEPFGPAQPDLAAKLAECLLAARLGPVRPDEVDGTRLAGPPAQDRAPACRPGRAFPDTDGEVAAAATWAESTGLLRGRPDGRYDPGAPLTRRAALLVLHRAAGSPAVDAPHGFPDVPPDDAELGAAARWAVAGGVVRGRADGRLSPQDPLTRGEGLRLLWRDAGRPGAPPSGFPDATGEVEQAAGWARAAGVVRGRPGGRLAPDEALTRGTWAVLLHRRHAVG